MLLFKTLAVLLLHTLTNTRVFAQTGLEQAVSALRPQLSSGAIVTFPWDPRWNELQLRGSSPAVSPHYNVVIEVATESDVQVIVTLASRLDIPFLAVSGTHGWTRTLNRLQSGIQINLRRLNSATLSQDGKTAVVGGGAIQYEITRALFARGKYAGMFKTHF
jgi:FAD/FMN-containing dehydrogenase